MSLQNDVARSFPADSRRQQQRSFWLRTLYQWHWISSALSLIGMLLFAATGLTLNHAAKLEAPPQVYNQMDELPPALLAILAAGQDSGVAPLPSPVSKWLSEVLPVAIGARSAEWTPEEIYLSMPTPGADAWLSIDRDTGAMEYESTHHGWIAYLNNLHRGHNAGPAWTWFIDIFAVACLVFCITGLFLLQMHARQRRMTWPLVGLGLLVPLLLALLLIH